MFLESLPAELRVNVYRIILGRTIVTKDPAEQHDMRLYRGIIFSCKQVLMEYKFEAEKFAVPINSSIHELWTFRDPVFIATPSEFSYPTDIQIAVPATLFPPGHRMWQKIKVYVHAIMPTLMAHHTRVTFSIHDASSCYIKARLQSYLVRLYNDICEVVAWEKDTFPYLMPLGKAKSMWKEKGYALRVGDNPPFFSFNYVALHMKRKTVVFDAHMSKDELETADSGHIWKRLITSRKARARKLAERSAVGLR